MDLFNTLSHQFVLSWLIFIVAAVLINYSYKKLWSKFLLGFAGFASLILIWMSFNASAFYKTDVRGYKATAEVMIVDQKSVLHVDYGDGKSIDFEVDLDKTKSFGLEYENADVKGLDGNVVKLNVTHNVRRSHKMAWLFNDEVTTYEASDGHNAITFVDADQEYIIVAV